MLTLVSHDSGIMDPGAGLGAGEVQVCLADSRGDDLDD